MVPAEMIQVVKKNYIVIAKTFLYYFINMGKKNIFPDSVMKMKKFSMTSFQTQFSSITETSGISAISVELNSFDDQNFTSGKEIM